MKKRLYTIRTLEERQQAKEFRDEHDKNVGMYLRELKKYKKGLHVLCRHGRGYNYIGLQFYKDKRERGGTRWVCYRLWYEDDESFLVKKKGKMPIKVIFSETGP